MATFSDGSDNVEVMEQAGLQPSILDAPANGILRVQLQALLDDKEKQLRLAGTLGQRFLAQQMELEERISQLNELEAAKTNADDEAVESEIRDKLQELSETMNAWESENQNLFGVLGNKVCVCVFVGLCRSCAVRAKVAHLERSMMEYHRRHLQLRFLHWTLKIRL